MSTTETKSRCPVVFPILVILLVWGTAGAQVPSRYLKEVVIPSYDPNNSGHFIITEVNGGWSEINNSTYRHFYVEPGNYGNVTITRSGTQAAPRTISLHNGNDLHPAKLDPSGQADVRLIFDGAEHWVVDRLSTLNYTDSDYATKILPVSKNIIINRMHFHNFYAAITIQSNTSDISFTEDITIQNSRLDKMTAAGINADRVAIMITGSNWRAYRRVQNLHILNNEIVNCNDGIMPIRHPELDGGHEVNYPGLIIDSNHIYVNSDVYTDGSGNHDPDGDYAWTENAIDLKGGSDDPDNPVIISNNFLWGYRRTDQNGGGSGSWGTVLCGHYHVKNLIIRNNVIFDGNRGISFGDPHGLPYSCENVVIENNIIAFIGEHPTSAEIGYSHCFYESKNVTFHRNVIAGTDRLTRWMSHDNSEVDLSVSCNVIIDMYQMTGTRASTTVVQDNTFYDTPIQAPGDGISFPNVNDANMTDLTFTTDRFTNNPRTITLPGVVSTNTSPHACDPAPVPPAKEGF